MRHGVSELRAIFLLNRYTVELDQTIISVTAQNDSTIMPQHDKLDESNFLLYAARNYDNPQCYDTIEFYDDLKRFKYIKRLLNRYEETGDLKERLVLNHVVILYNIFGPQAATRMLFLKLKGQEKYLKPFLVFINVLPERVENIGVENKTIITSDIPMDLSIIQALRKI